MPKAKRIDDTPEIAALERAIVAAFDENMAFARTSAEEIARLRPGVVEQARHVCNGLRAEHAARQGTKSHG